MSADGEGLVVPTQAWHAGAGARTVWVTSDDGFLILDANGNGRVDGIGEMFGSREGGGFAELALYDSNGDGAITAADLIWSSLQIRQDRTAMPSPNDLQKCKSGGGESAAAGCNDNEQSPWHGAMFQSSATGGDEFEELAA